MNIVWINEDDLYLANSSHFVFTPKIDFLGDMTPTISQMTFPPLVRFELMKIRYSWWKIQMIM